MNCCPNRFFLKQQIFLPEVWSCFNGTHCADRFRWVSEAPLAYLSSF
jgi:hypothetical protein